MKTTLSSSLIFVALCLLLTLAGFAQSNDDRLRAQQHLSAGNALLLKGNAEQASIEFEKVIALLPSFSIGYINRGLAYASMGKYVEALADADKAMTYAGQEPNSATYRAMAYQIKGAVYYSQRDYKRSIEAYSSGIELEPTNAKYHNGRGIAYLALEQYDQALQDFGKTIELDPKLSQPYVNRSVIYKRRKDHASAIRDLESALALDPYNAGAYSNRGSSYLELKKYEEAVADYSKAISLDPKWEFFYNRGRAYFDQGKFQAAVDDNSEAIRRNPSSPKGFRNRAIAYHRLGKNDLAVNDLKQAVSINGSSASYRYNLAYILLRSGRYEEAVGEATKMIGQYPQWRDPYVLRAEANAKLGSAAKANADRAIASKLNAAWKPSEEDFLIFDMTFYERSGIDQ